MPLAGNIVVRMSGDANPFIRELDRGIRALDDFAASAARTQRVADAFSFKAPKLDVGDSPVSDVAATGEAAAAQAQQQAAQMRAAFQSGLAPLGQVAARIEAQLNVVGGTIVTLARRIDSEMKLPKADAALAKLQQKIRGEIGKGAAAAEESLGRLRAAVLRLGPAADKSIGAFRGLLKAKNFLGDLGDVARRPLDRLFNLRPAIAQADQLSGRFGSISPTVGVATGAIKRMGVEIALALGAFGLAFKAAQGLKNFLAGGIKGASDLNESVNKLGVIFEGQAGIVSAAADEMAARFGVVKTEFIDTSSTFGQLLQSMGGQSQKAAAETSVQLTKLAADASSIFNTSFDEAAGKIASALRGQSEPISAFGIDVQEAATKQEAFRLGLIKAGQEMNTQQKVAARTSLIVRGLAVAEGDLANTADAPANAMRRFSGTMQNAAATIGTALLPAVQKGLGLLNEFASWLSRAFERNQGVFDDFAAGVAAAFDTVGAIFRNLPLAWEIVKLKFLEGAANILSYIETIPANLAIIGDYIANNWRELIVDGLNGVVTAFGNLGTNFGDLQTAISNFFAGEGWEFNPTPLLAGFKATAAALPELIKPGLVSMQAEIDAAAARIAANEQARLPEPGPRAAAARRKAPDPISQETLDAQKKLADDAKKLAETMRSPLEEFQHKVGEYGKMLQSRLIDRKTYDRAVGRAEKELAGDRFAGALELGSKDAYSALLQFNAGRSKDDVNKSIAESNKRQVDLQSQMVTELRKFNSGSTSQPAIQTLSV